MNANALFTLFLVATVAALIGACSSDTDTGTDETETDGDAFTPGDPTDGDSTNQDGDEDNGTASDDDDDSVLDGDSSDDDDDDNDDNDDDNTLDGDGSDDDDDDSDGDETDGDTTDGDDPSACLGLTLCPGEEICNLSLGRCEARSTQIDAFSGFSAFHPPAGGQGDLLVIDGTRFFHSLVGNFSVKVWIGTTQLTLANSIAWDENRLLVRVPSQASGIVGVQCEGGLLVQSTESFGIQAAGVVACDGSTPAASETGPLGPTHLGPFAAGYLDHTNDGIRVYYPADCGSLRRPAIAGSYPLVAILHGNGAGHVNYEYLGQLLASRGFVVVNPPSEHTNNYEETVIDKLYADITLFHGKDLGTLHPALQGVSTNGELGFICHSRGCGRQQEMLGDYPALAADTKASVFLGPANLNEVVPGLFMVFGATKDGQSFPANYNGQYDRQSAPKWKIVLQGGNHSLFADAKIYYSFDGIPTITRKRQLTVVASFAIPLMERAFGFEEEAPQWLDTPPASPDYTVDWLLE